MDADEFDEKCEEIQEKIMAITDTYSDYISKITIEWKEKEDER
jgi:hypothetical protein